MSFTSFLTQWCICGAYLDNILSWIVIKIVKWIIAELSPKERKISRQESVANQDSERYVSQRYSWVTLFIICGDTEILRDITKTSLVYSYSFRIFGVEICMLIVYCCSLNHYFSHTHMYKPMQTCTCTELSHFL